MQQLQSGLKTINFNSQVISAMKRILPWLMFLVVAVPFVCADSFTTLDGPGHIHNAEIIKSLWTEPNGIFSKYYELNTFISPNLMGHYLLLFVVEIVGVSYADRVMLALCMLAQFAAIRYFVRSLKLSDALALLPICFLLNTPLFSGFFSFSLGVAGMFWAVGFFIRRADRLWLEGNNARFMLGLSALLVLVYLLHLVPAVIACALVAIIFLADVFKYRKTHNWKLYSLWLATRPLAMAAMPVSVLIVVYQLHDSETSNYVFIESRELWRQWGVMQGFIINHRHELAFTRWYWIVPGIAIAMDWALLVFKVKSIQRMNWPAHALGLLFGFVTLIAALYFLMPDATSGGGALSVRLNFLLLTVMMLLLLAFVRTFILQWMAVAVLLFVTIDHSQKILSYHKEQAYFMSDVQEVSRGIDRPGVLLVHRFRYDWPLEHVTKYLGNVHDVVMVDALGGHKIYAPVMWSPELRNSEDMVQMLDQGWKHDPIESLKPFAGERLYILTIGELPQADSAAWSHWSDFFADESAACFSSSDSLMHLYRLR